MRELLHPAFYLTWVLGIEIDPYAFKVVLLTGIYAKTLVHCILLPLPWYFGVNMVIECIVLIFEYLFFF